MSVMRVNNQWRWLSAHKWPSGRAYVLRLDLTNWSIGFELSGRDGQFCVGFGPVQLVWRYSREDAA